MEGSRETQEAGPVSGRGVWHLEARGRELQVGEAGAALWWGHGDKGLSAEGCTGGPEAPG